MNNADPTIIEEQVGRSRHETLHYGRADHDDKMFYILHSFECLNSGIELPACRFSLAFDKAVSDEAFDDNEWPEGPVELDVDRYGYIDHME